MRDTSTSRTGLLSGMWRNVTGQKWPTCKHLCPFCVRSTFPQGAPTAQGDGKALKIQGTQAGSCLSKGAPPQNGHTCKHLCPPSTSAAAELIQMFPLPVACPRCVNFAALEYRRGTGLFVMALTVPGASIISPTTHGTRPPFLRAVAFCAAGRCAAQG